jgi:alpha-glucosidase (family GH31 glycosyl hydrolase)
MRKIADPKNLSILLFFLLFSVFQTGKAQDAKNIISIQLKDKNFMTVNVCSDNIFRIRISEGADPGQSLLERYGILKSDWGNVNPTIRKGKNITVIQSGQFRISVNKESGNISVKDLNNKSVINSINIYPKSDRPETRDLSESIQKYFAGEKHGENIIGDENYLKAKPDSIKSGTNILPSLLEVQLDSDERFYGGGSTSRKNIQHRGELLRMWATYQQTEIPMPFLMSSKGWAIFNNTTSLNYFDVGRFEKDRLIIYNTNGDMDFYLMLGNSMQEAISLYTSITGNPYLLPEWAYGLAFGGNTMEDQMGVMNDAVRFRDEKIPCDIYWLEPQWMAKNYDFSTSQNWDLKKFPAEPFWEEKNPKKYEHPLLFISKLHKLGFKLALWLCIDHDLSVAEEDQIAEKSGKQQSGQEHWFSHLTKLIDQGVDGFKLDPGRTLDEHPDMKYYNGYTDREMHNLNQVLLPKQMYETFRNHKGIRSFHHYCGGYAGAQHWGASTSGDNGGGKDALFDQLNLGLSGFVNTSADVMEVEDTKAGIHMGFFLPWVQVNSWYALHHPWYLPPVEKETFRFYDQLRHDLIPYIYSAALEGSQTGMPILRAMPLVFPDDRNTDNMIYQYMFGENLLVGVFSDSIYLPKGTWINYWTGAKFNGGKTVHCSVPENRGGLLFIKNGAIIPFQKTMQYVGEYPPDTLILKVYPEAKSSYTLLEDDGKTFEYENGNISRTLFECTDDEKETDFNIFPSQGSYSGMIKNMTYQLELNIPERPSRIMVNNTLAENWKYSEPGKVTVIISRKDNGKVVIQVFKK